MKNGIVVIGTVFVDIKGFPEDVYLPEGRNAGNVVYVHGGVARNVVEDIANLELRPTFISSVDDTPMGKSVFEKLVKHKVNMEYVSVVPNSMGTWLAVFDHNGDLAGSISKRPSHEPVFKVLEEKGDEIFAEADAVILQADLHKDIVNKVFALAEKYGTKLYALISNMTIATERRDFAQRFDCFICNQQEAGILFVDNYDDKTPEELCDIISERIEKANIPAMIVTMGGAGSVYANRKGEKGICPAKKVEVRDTTGAGDSFCAGAMSALTYGKSLREAVEVGTTLAASVIVSSENVCPRFQPAEFGIERGN